MRIRADIAELLREGVPEIRIARQLGVAPATVRRAREALGLPRPRRGRRDSYSSLEEAFRAHVERMGEGHLRWTGYVDARRNVPYVCHRQQRVTAARVAFRLHHGRTPEGPVWPSCDMEHCVAGAHLEDRRIREANRRADAADEALFGGAA
ncbi:helix-turn-helix domain-containing protein [Streptomyces sp. NPDC051133]|uniref:helix-turn-helix domain-containing protein n=1 Tax=Streptomyces sp. NPDC051133 TaxID=3155521 RepID=UPI00344149FD